jgi:DNA-binding NarL/FixJ family response regulator
MAAGQKTIRVLTVGDHALLRKGIRALIDAEADMQVVAEASNGREAGEDELSEREIEVLRLIAAGNANKELAAQLGLAEDTVKRHVTNILSKLRANDRTHAVTIGLKRGIIEL